MVGLGATRHTLGVEPLASALHETIVAAVTPTVRRYLAETSEPNAQSCLTGSNRPQRARVPEWALRSSAQLIFWGILL
jgi:hypothetical protein